MMPPSTFASAAAGSIHNQTSTREGSSEWSRRPNGATQTFRRQPSTTAISAAPVSTDSTPIQTNPPRYVPPHRNGAINDSRYSKSQLLDLFRSQQGSEGALKEGLSHLYVSGWQPETNGASSGWGRNEHSRDAHQSGPEVCWDRDGAVEPLGLTDLDDQEREIFSGSVNTPLKPTTVQNKENHQANGLQGRKVSISQSAASPGGFGLPSPSTTRSGMRRRETSESYPFPTSLTSPTGRDDHRATSPPPSLLRRKTDMKEDDEKSGNAGFGSLRRNPTSAGLNGPSSPWSTTPMGGFPAMGSFQQSDKRTGLGSGRAESRFKGVLSKDSNEEIGAKFIDRKGSISSLHKVDEGDAWRQDRNEPANAPLDEVDETGNLLTGSAALGATSDASPSRVRQGTRGLDTPNRSARDEHGFGAFGMTSDFGGMHQTPAHRAGHEPMSPTDTNPYQSPDPHASHQLHEDHEDPNDVQSRLPGLGGFNEQHLGLGGLGAFPGLGGLNNPQGPSSDRSQTSSVGPARGFPGLGGLGQIGNVASSSGWPQSAGGRQGLGMPSAFGQNVFGGETQSSSLAGLGGFGNQGHAGRLASMFPPSMQDQMSLRDSEHDFEDDRNPQAFGTIGSHGQDAEDALTDHSGQSNQPPAPQQRTMVMPDRMRWEYKDPQGQKQGPWSGLEMHDWYRAGFFSPELLVKKAEDSEYEPLAQLIRRIGNSREPFLVPQIGIPHGPPSTQGPWAGLTGSVAAGAQPPFPSSFPSFGTTLTAEQQNALERRKQEEQYLMARQKEHLAQAQIAQRMQMANHGFGSGHLQNLNHHASAQSLHSQPSLGSMTSPSAYQPSPTQAPTMYDGAMRGQQGHGPAGVDTLEHIREEEIPSILERLNLGRTNTNQFGAPGQPFAQAQARNVQQMLQDRAMLQQEQAHHDATQLEQSENNERLRDFQQLQGQMMDKQYQQLAETRDEKEPLSLTEQVQKAASAKHSPAVAQQAWSKVDAGLAQGFPPAPSQSPLPAPAAQRTGRQSVADQLAQESSRSQSPALDTSSAAIAPWAKEPSSETARGPSLREIQEAEAKQAAEAEELAAASRRAIMLKEMELQALAAANNAPAQPGLPAGATWATGSPATPTGNSSPWSKAAPQKPTLTQTKSMAQIQKEEEARKKKLVAAQAQANANVMAGVVTPAGGKSYANLASKTGPASVPSAGGAWTTVGASGKVKAPGAPSPVATRAVSSGMVPTVSTATAARKAPVRSATMSLPGVVSAMEDFKKWAVAELRPDLSKGISPEDFVATLISLGLDLDIIIEAVHMSSNTIDSRHFAEEFIRRRRLAEKGIVDATAPKSVSPSNAGGAAGGGWSEVAKKGPLKEPSKEETNGSFRVVASKKKSGKR